MRVFVAILPLLLMSGGVLAKPAGYGGGPSSGGAEDFEAAAGRGAENLEKTIGRSAEGLEGAIGRSSEDFEDGVGGDHHAPTAQQVHGDAGNDVVISAPTHGGYSNKPASQPSNGQEAASKGHHDGGTNGGAHRVPAAVSRPSYASQRRTKSQSGYGGGASYGGTTASSASQNGYGSTNGGQGYEPYSFAYTAGDAEGSHSHSAQADAQGRVTGEYTIQLADGRSRKVKYTADENGYRADIVTNELGTESKNPADVTIQSSAPTGEEAAHQSGGAGNGGSYGGGTTSAGQSYDSQSYTKSQPFSQSNSFYSGARSGAGSDHHGGSQGGAEAGGHHSEPLEQTPRRRNNPSYG